MSWPGFPLAIGSQSFRLCQAKQTKIPLVAFLTPLIKGVEVHPLNCGGGVSKALCFHVFFEPHPLKLRG